MWNLSVVSSFSKILTILGAIFFFYLDHFIFQRKSSSFASSSIVVLSTLLKMQRGENKGFWEVIIDKNVDHYTCIVTQISSDICHNIPSSHLCLLKMKAIKFMKMIFSLGEGGGAKLANLKYGWLQKIYVPIGYLSNLHNLYICF